MRSIPLKMCDKQMLLFLCSVFFSLFFRVRPHVKTIRTANIYCLNILHFAIFFSLQCCFSISIYIEIALAALVKMSYKISRTKGKLNDSILVYLHFTLFINLVRSSSKCFELHLVSNIIHYH